ncbi:MAG: diphosphomevalonate decarboxylase [Bacteroidota bacterium]
MTEKDFAPSGYSKSIAQGSVVWKAPSNIALVKYWGKKEGQIPANPSVSLTLDASATTTKLSFSKLKQRNPDFSFDVFLDGKLKLDFKPKIQTFFERILRYMPFLKDYHLTIETVNSFPHSSGIASSASGMAALSLCLMEIERAMAPTMAWDYFYQKSSFLARLGSGSACRSIQGDIVQWGKHTEVEGSSDLYGIARPFAIHDVFSRFHDTILLVDKGKKQVSSTVGHGLMQGHPFAEKRFGQAHRHIADLKRIFAQGDVPAFIRIVESEALTLHAMMMSSNPYFVLMKPNTLEIIDRIWEFRRLSGTHLCFTLDAGANVHVLYPESEKGTVYPFLTEKLTRFCENGQFICDRVGTGARRIKGVGE